MKKNDSSKSSPKDFMRLFRKTRAFSPTEIKDAGVREHMNYAEIQRKQKRIQALRVKIELIRAEGEKTTASLSPSPNSSQTSDKVGNTATSVLSYENDIKGLQKEIDAAVDSLPDTLEGNCIRLRIKRHYSWRKLSFVVGGSNTAESIKKMCYRYKW